MSGSEVLSALVNYLSALFYQLEPLLVDELLKWGELVTLLIRISHDKT
jgi:hypothetical protein